MAALLASAAIAVLSMISLALSTLARGRRRLLSQRISIYSALPSLTAVLVLLPLRLKLSFSDGLSLAGLIVSLLFGLGARAMDRMTSRLRIGVVIPSRVPFHAELRQGLKEAMSAVRLDVYDDYLVTNRAVERLSEFLPALRRTLTWRPDYLAICSPSVPLVSSEQVLTLLMEFVRKGGGIVLIDNEPTEDVRACLGVRYGRVTSDVETGARIIAEYVKRHIKDTDELLVLCGPPSSDPAELRRKILNETLPNATLMIADTGGWTEQSAYAVTVTSFQDGLRPRFIICGNDVMAFGAIRALRQIRKEQHAKTLPRCEVIGYDGIARALFAIAEEDNPFAATLSTPPAAYGHEIAAMILDDARRLPGKKSRLSHCNIPASDGQLVTSYNVEMVLDN